MQADLHTHDSKYPDYGIIYNSRRPVGGVRYVQPTQQKIVTRIDQAKQKSKSKRGSSAMRPLSAELQSNNKQQSLRIPSKLKDNPYLQSEAKTKVVVKIPSPEQKTKSSFELVNKITEAQLLERELNHQTETQEERATTKIYKAHSNIVPEKTQDNTDYQQELKAQHEAKRKYKYVIEVEDHDIDFTAVGIQPSPLSEDDKIWISHARDYFLNAQENNKRVGSAEEYTSFEILHSLWSTAQQVGIDPKRFIVQIYNESRFNPNAKGRAGERGIGQFKRPTAQMLGYDWGKMNNGAKGFAYQAKCAAEFIQKVGEKKYNGAGEKSNYYVRRISSKVNQIDSLV